MPTMRKRELFTLGEWARGSGPVLHDDRTGVWSIVSHAGVRAMLGDPRTFSNDLRRAGLHVDELTPPSLLDLDPPRHHQLRRLVAQAFTPRAIERLEPRIAELCASMLPDDGERRMDVVARLAAPLPLAVIAELLGIDEERRGEMGRWSRAAYVSNGPGGPPPDVVAVVEEMHEHALDLAARRRRQPTEDMVSGLVAASVDGARLTDDEYLGFFTLLLVAGNETTRNLIAAAVLCLDRHPDVRRRLRREPALLPGFVEEVLRYLSPVQHALPRLTTTDATIEGVTIPAGEVVFGHVAPANRDPAVFDAPDDFDVERSPNPHLGFGHGIHFCLGAPLARLEARIAIAQMLRRLHGEWEVPDEPIAVPPPPMFILSPGALTLTWSGPH